MRKLRKICLTFIFACLMCVLMFGGVACTEDKQVTLKFNVNGGDPIKSIELDEGEPYVLPTPTREGYSFEGWYTNADFSGDPVTEIIADDDSVYYAKWEQVYLVTLELNGGSLEHGTIALKAGDVIYDSVKSYVPVKGEFQFGDWFVDEAMTKPLGKNTRMAEGGVTLYAKYKVPYTVEIWKEELDNPGTYEKSAENMVGYEYAGVTYTSEPKVTGFREIFLDNDEYESVVTLEISETASENVFKHYFNRESYTVRFNANYPDGTVSEVYSSDPVLYEKSVELPFNYTCDGYCLVGWETNGKVYKTNYIEHALYGSDPATIEAEKFYPEKDTTLYGVWLKGYADMFGNGDYVYLLEDVVTNEETGESKTVYSVYLSRGGILFKGTYQAKANEFAFENVDKETVLKGKVYEDGTFVYSNSSRAEVSYQRFIFGQNLVEEKLNFGEYNQITYYSEDGSRADGTYTINEDNYIVATFDSGDLENQTLTLTVGYVLANDGSGSYTRVFQIRNEQEKAMGELVCFAVTLSEGETYLNYYIYYTLTLDGFNTATMCVGPDSYETYHYIYDEDTKQLLLYTPNNYSEPALTGEIMTLECFDGQERTGYAEYTEDLNGSFKYNGGTLTLDGYFNVSYERADGTVLETYYTMTQSVLGGTLISFYDRDREQRCNLIIKVEEVSYNGMIFTSYSTEEKSENYGEYYYLDDDGLMPYPLFVVNGEEASFYGYNSSVGYVKVTTGSLEYDADTDTYTYEVGDTFVSDDDLAKLDTVVLSLDAGETYYYSLHYWYSYTEKGGEPVDCDESYTSEKGGKLTLVSGIAIYEQDGSIIKGIYSKNDDGVVVIQNAKGEVVCVKIIDEETFVKLEFEKPYLAPYTAYLYVNSFAQPSADESISFDGLGGATYSVKTLVEEGEVEGEGEGEGEDQKFEMVPHKGKVVKEESTTAQGVYVYKFTCDDTCETCGEEPISFRFIQLQWGDYACFAKENTEIAKEYDTKDYGKLELDGFGFYATYEGEEGYYYVLSETEIVVELDGVERYFDLDGNGGFTIRGVEYGYYMYSRNQYAYDVDFLLDGYGNLTVITYTYDENGKASEERQTGEYTQDGDVFTLVYGAEDETPVVKKGKLGVSYMSYGGQIIPIPTFIEDLEVSQLYVNPDDLSILELDSYGNAVKYTATGVKENGTYLLITDKLLYYVNEAQSDACVYTYNKTTGVATIVALTDKGYYTEDFESLIFTKYGFAIFENQTYYYYYVEYDEEDGKEKVTLYREARDGEEVTVNEYGFVEEVFCEGEFPSEKEYNGKTYYENNSLTVVFKRDEKTKTQYDAGYGLLENISFSPTGDKAFSVVANVVINGKPYKGTVTRNEEGKTYLYVDLYCYDIELTYLGEGESTYKITRMREMVTALPYLYSYVAMMYNFFGLIYENEEGQLSIVVDYNLQEVVEEGKTTWKTVKGEPYFATEFLAGSGLYNSNGNIVEAPEGTKVYDAEGNEVTKLSKLDLTGETAYTASFVSDDGYTYYFHFAIGPAQYAEDMYEFYLYSFTREEILSYTDETTGTTYEITLQRTIRSDSRSYTVGTVYNVKMAKTVEDVKEELKVEAWYTDFDGSLKVIVREKDDNGKVLSSVYYTFTFEEYVEVEEEEPTPEEGEEETTPEEGAEGDASEEETEEIVDKNPLPLYKSVLAVTETAVKTIYTADGVGYLDITEDTNEAMVLCVDGITAYIVQSSSYDEDTGVYTVNLSETMVYSVTVEEDEEGNKYITVESVETKEEESEE